MPRSREERLFLVGMMGCGKSTLGKQLAKRLRRPFIDSDTELEARTGASIPTIFDLEGESGFREREAAVLAELTLRPGVVLATGGGVVMRPENRALLRERGTVIYLHAEVPILVERTRSSRNRPLLFVADPEQRMKQLYAQRDPLYRATAHVVVESDHGKLTTLIQRVLQGLAEFRRTAHGAQKDEH